MRVLLVEDDPDVSDTICLMLKNFFRGVDIQHISDGALFWKGLWRSMEWDLVILDLMMPGVTGFEVCKQIRAHIPTSMVPILALTGYDTLQNEEKIKAAGANGYMAKPFEVMKIKEEIERLLLKAGNH